MSDKSSLMSKKIVIMGSTGSIGCQALDVIHNLGYEVVGLGAGTNIVRLAEQIEKFSVKIVSVAGEKQAEDLKEILRYKKINGVDVYSGKEGLLALADIKCDIFLNAIMGIKGLEPTLKAIKNGYDVAIANKEPLVAAGRLIMDTAKEYNVRILPVDSEHSAVFQCINGRLDVSLKNILLTASGGPFRTKTYEELESVTINDALIHPTWKMGYKITIDCATLMNKGLEVMEAMNLYNLPASKIKVVVHPQSIIHSMVTFEDDSVLAQMSNPDMKIPIQYALTYPARYPCHVEPLDLVKISSLTFEEPDKNKFPCLAIAYDAAQIGGTMPAVMNGANEQAVQLFLDGMIKFTQIPDVIKKVMDNHLKSSECPFEKTISAENVVYCSRWSGKEVNKILWI